MRKSVVKFSKEMEKVLNRNSHRGGWKGCEVEWLLGMAKQNIETALRYGFNPDVPNHFSGEIIDAANYLMMAYDNLPKNKVSGEPKGRGGE